MPFVYPYRFLLVKTEVMEEFVIVNGFWVYLQIMYID